MKLEKIAKNFLNVFLASAISLSGASSSINRPYGEDSKYVCNYSNAIKPGNLSFYFDDNYLPNAEIMRIMGKVQDNFCKIGIKFNRAAIFQDKNFPYLGSNLDLLILINKNIPINVLWGAFGLDFQSYLELKEETGFKYNRKTAQANIGYVKSLFMIDDIEKKLPRFLSHEEKIRLMTQVLTHEAAHGLGASHFDVDSGNDDYFMGLQNPEKEQSFYSGNVIQMKKFIAEIKMSNLDKKGIIEMRKSYLIIPQSFKKSRF